MISSESPTRLLLTALLCLSLAACGSSGKSRQTAKAENLYLSAAGNHIDNGMVAMQHERWPAAERAFERALRAAQLADHMPLVIQSWYNLAVTRTSMERTVQAAQAYRRCIELSKRHREQHMQMRATLGLALLQLRSGETPETPELPDSLYQGAAWPADIHLQAARLAHLQNQTDKAAATYRTVIAKQGESISLLKLKARAHMGLALLARAAGDSTTASQQSELALALCRKTGMPRLTAHALLLQGQLPADAVAFRVDRAERALDIYAALNDLQGQKQSLATLIELTKDSPDRQKTERYRLRLHEIDAKLGEQAE